VSNITKNNDELNVKKVLSVRINEIDYKILKQICDKKNISLNSYANKILKNYINNNSEKIKEKLGLDIIGMKRQLLAELKNIKFKKELSEFEKEAIDNMSEIFKTALEISEEKLKKLLNLSQESLDKILFANNEELRRRGLKLKYISGKILKVDSET